MLLLGLAMRNMLSASTAKLLELKTLSGLFLVLGRDVIPFFALGALQYYVISHDRNSLRVPLRVTRGCKKSILATRSRPGDRRPLPSRFDRNGRNNKMEPTTGLEPVTSSLPRTRSTY